MASHSPVAPPGFARGPRLRRRDGLAHNRRESDVRVALRRALYPPPRTNLRRHLSAPPDGAGYISLRARTTWRMAAWRHPAPTVGTTCRWPSRKGSLDRSDLPEGGMGVSDAELRDGTPAIETGGSLRSRPHLPACHERPGVHDVTTSQPTIYGSGEVSGRRKRSCPPTLDVDRTLSLRPRRHRLRDRKRATDLGTPTWSAGRIASEPHRRSPIPVARTLMETRGSTSTNIRREPVGRSIFQGCPIMRRAAVSDFGKSAMDGPNKRVSATLFHHLGG